MSERIFGRKIVRDLTQMPEEELRVMSLPAEVEHDLQDALARQEEMPRQIAELNGEEGTIQVRLERNPAELVRRHRANLLRVLEDNLDVPLRKVLEWEESIKWFGNDPAVTQEVIDTAFVYIDWLKERGCNARANLLMCSLQQVEDACYSCLRSVCRGHPLREELRMKAAAIGVRMDAMLPEEDKR